MTVGRRLRRIIKSPNRIVGFGTRHILRTRGAGWRVCPNCNEHASHDVVDDIRYVVIPVLRLVPTGRTRYLVCRRCGYRYIATPEAMSELATEGKRIRRGTMIPVGLLMTLLIGGAAAYAIITAPAATVAGIEFENQSGDPVIPVTVDLPNWSIQKGVDPDTNLPYLSDTDSSEANYSAEVIKYSGVTSLDELAQYAFSSEINLHTTNVPSTMPTGTCTTIDGQPAYTTSFRYQFEDLDTVAIIYVFERHNVGYTLILNGSTTSGISAIRQVSDHLVKSIKWTDANATDAPTLTPSPTAAPTPKPKKDKAIKTPAASPTPAPLSC